jgi:hypothetical protein
MSTLDELTRLERSGWDSLCASTGDHFYGDLMADDGLMVLADGSVLDHGQVVSSLADAPAWDRFEMTDERVVPLPGGAVLVYRATAWRGDAPPFTAVMASTYRHEHDGWRLALYQQTPVP